LFRRSGGPNGLILFLGRFHPVLVRLTIGGLVLLGVLELLAKFSHFKDAAQNNRLILGLTAAASVIAALLDWMLSQQSQPAGLVARLAARGVEAGRQRRLERNRHAKSIPPALPCGIIGMLS
jgi:hypothetical protein